jgi:hypothetical protein
MTRRRYILLLLIVTAAGGTLLLRPDRGPLYHGRRTADWVDEALKQESRGKAFEAVLKIGAPAVPFIAKGLHDRSHRFHFLSADSLMYFSDNHPRLGRWITVENCAGKHAQAAWLLWCMGTNGQAAIPDVTDCLEHCTSMHVVGAMDLFDALAAISGTNPAAIPYLTKRARGADSLCLRAATTAYYINGRTNLFVETCERLSRQEPEWLLDGPELFWFREDRELNQHLVPLLEKLYLDPKLAARERGTALDELAYRTNDPAAVLFCARFLQKPAVSVAAH